MKIGGVDTSVEAIGHLADAFRTGVRLHLIRPPKQDE
jgi:hypothetical protein